MRDLATELAHVVAFRGLDAATLARIAAACQWERHEAGAQIIHHEDTDRDILILLSGRARVCVYAPNGQPVTFREIGAGDVFGELSAIDGAPRSAFVEALAPSQTARLPADRLRGLIAAEPAFSIALLTHFALLVRDLSDRLVAATSQKADQRIRGELLRLAAGVKPHGKSVVLSPAPLQADMAARIGTQREAVSRELARLSRAGLVSRRGADLVIHDLQALRDLWAASMME